MKKQILKAFWPVAGLFFGSLTMVGCYESDDSVDYTEPVVTPTPTPDPAKYYVTVSVMDSKGNTLENAEVKCGTELWGKGSFYKELSEPKSYTLDVVCENYVSVKRTVVITPVLPGQVSSLSVDITLTSYEEQISAGSGEPSVPPTIVDQSSEDVIAGVKELISDTDFGESVTVGEITAEETVVDGQKAMAVTIPVTMKTPSSEPVKVSYVDFSGFDITEAPKQTRAMSAEEMWTQQAQNYLGGLTTPLTKVSKEETLNENSQSVVAGYSVTLTWIEKELTFPCGPNLDNYTGKVKYRIGSAVVKTVYADDTHDDSHDDHHDNGGTSWGGGTTSGN